MKEKKPLLVTLNIKKLFLGGGEKNYKDHDQRKSPKIVSYKLTIYSSLFLLIGISLYQIWIELSKGILIIKSIPDS